MNAETTETTTEHSNERQVPVNRRMSRWTEEKYTVGEDRISWEASRTEERSQRDPETGEVETWESEVSDELVWDGIETREVNEYAVFSQEKRSFESTASGSRKKDNIDLICFDGEAKGVLDLDDEDNWDIPHQYERSYRRLNGNTPELMRKYVTSSSSDRQRSYSKYRTEITRELIERYDEVYAVKWRYSHSADRNGSSSSKTAKKAVKLEVSE